MRERHAVRRPPAASGVALLAGVCGPIAELIDGPAVVLLEVFCHALVDSLRCAPCHSELVGSLIL